MVKVILSGCFGRMGMVIAGLAKNDNDIEIAAGIDVVKAQEACPYPVFSSFGECDVKGDVIIDFSSPLVFDELLDYAAENGTPAVICTTGLSDEQIKRINDESSRVALLRSANMSLGINLIMKLLKEAAGVLKAEGFDPEIVERHHGQKKDAPSGTAIALAESINKGVDEKYDFIYDRSGRYEKRGSNELGISAVRGGTIVGEHEVIFAGTDEVIEFKHTAYSRAIFAKGALAAAKFMKGKKDGLYDMSDVIG